MEHGLRSVWAVLLTVLRRRLLPSSPPALECRLIAFPKAQDKAFAAGHISTLEVARHALKYGTLTATAPAASLHGRDSTLH
jgi:hypothetical protein